jgi:hypothetical protein
VVAYRAGCGGRARVRDFAPEAQPATRGFATYLGPRIAGPYLALRTYDDAGAPVVRVLDWRSGFERYRVPVGYPDRFDVQADGGVAFVESDPASDDEELMSASEADPEPQVLDTAGYIGDPRVAADRVAYGRTGGLFVRSLDGPLVASAPARALLDVPDFDGARLTWAQSPCVKVTIAVWDLHGEPPGLPPARCPLPRLVKRDLTSGKRQLPLPIECPASASEGCRGDVEIRRGGVGITDRRVVDVGAGRRRTAKLRLSHYGLCTIGRSDGAARAFFTRYRPKRVSRREVRVEGLERARAAMCDDE